MTKVELIGNVIVITGEEGGSEVLKMTFIPSIYDGDYVKVIEAVGKQKDGSEGFCQSERISHESFMEWMKMCTEFPRRRPRNR